MTACSCVEMVNAGIMAAIKGKRLQVIYSPNGRFLAQETFPKNLPRFVLILISLQRWQHRARNETKHFVSPHLIGPQLHQHDSSVKIKMAAPMEVSLPQTMLQKLLDLSKLESLKFCLKIQVHVIRHICCQVNIDYHNTSSVLPSVESYPNYRKPMQRGVQGYLSSLQRRVQVIKTAQKSIIPGHTTITSNN